MRVLLAITGASAMPVAAVLLRLLGARPDVYLGVVASPAAQEVWKGEVGVPLEEAALGADVRWAPDDLGAAPASGSWWQPTTAMVIAPCSMNTLAALAHGLTGNLIQRAGFVAIKEARRLILIPRETPLSSIALRNMLILREAGAVIMPFSPGFYLHPRSIEEMCEQFCWRVLDQLDLSHPFRRWGSGSDGLEHGGDRPHTSA